MIKWSFACFNVNVIILEVKFEGNRQVKQYVEQVALKRHFIVLALVNVPLRNAINWSTSGVNV